MLTTRGQQALFKRVYVGGYGDISWRRVGHQDQIQSAKCDDTNVWCRLRTLLLSMNATIFLFPPSTLSIT
jgi:hypothetical protein